MELRYDRDADVLYIQIRGGPVAESDEIEEGVIVDYDSEGRIVGIEILNARKRRVDVNKIIYEQDIGLPVVV